MSTALVTGSFGFAATALRGLLRDNGWTIVGCGRSRRDAPPGESYVAVDLTDATPVSSIVDAVRPDVVFHLAASSPQKVAGDPSALVRDGVLATVGLCEALRRTGVRTRLVLAGSSAQYGAVPVEQNPITETTLCRPAGAYGHAKVAAEAVALAYGSMDLEVVAARPFNHIGPGEPAATVAGAFAARVAAVAAGESDVVEAADLGAVRDFTDVRDIVRGYLALATRGRPGRVYNLCSGRATPVGHLLDLLLDVVGLDRSVVQEKVVPPGPVPYQVGSAARAEAEVGWRAEIELRQSLADLLGRSVAPVRPVARMEGGNG